MNLEIIRELTTRPGRRPPIVFIHGACHAAWCWKEHFLKFFADEGFHAYAVSLRGHGGSDGGKWLRWYGTRHYLNDILRAVHASGATPILVGHSMGARLAILHAARYGGVEALILLAPPPPCGVVPSVCRQFGKMFWPMVQNTVGFTWKHVSQDPRYAKATFLHPNLTGEMVAKHVERLGDESAVEFFQMFVPLFPWDRKVTCPVKVIGAALDQIFTPEEVQATAGLFGVTADIKPDMAHDIMLDPNWRVAAQDMVNWLLEQRPEWREDRP